MFVYEQTAEQLWTVGHYDSNERWHAESDHDSPESAAKRAAWLNGDGYLPEPVLPKIVEILRAGVDAVDRFGKGESAVDALAVTLHAMAEKAAALGEQ